MKSLTSALIIIDYQVWLFERFGVKLDKDIITAKLYNIYGIEVNSFKLNSFTTNGLRKGIYIFKVSVKNETITQKIIVE